jgi:hypothetical protein
MNSQPLIHGIEFFAAPQHLATKGLIAFAQFTYGGIRLHAVELRRTQRGDYVLSWPRLAMDRGQVRCAVRPISDESRQELEAPIIEAARRKGLLP